MRGRLTPAIGFVVGIGLLGLAVWAVVQGVQAEPGIVGSVITATVGFGAVALDHQRRQRAEMAQTHRDKLLPFYEGLLKQIRDFAMSDGEGDVKPETVELLGGLQQELILSGSARVVRAYGEWSRQIVQLHGGEAHPSVLFTFERLLLAIRADLGHDDSNLERGDLLRLFVTDIDDFLASERATGV